MQEQPPPSLPASLRAAWGRGDRPTRGPKPALSLERIVEAAVRVADAEGLAGVSMARVAEELGASTMSLYRYVAAKDELTALMVDAAWGPPPPGEAGEAWRAALTRWAWSFRDRARHHPWGLRVPISGPPLTPNAVAWFESGLAALRDASLSEEEKASVVLLLSGYVRNEAALVADLDAARVTNDEAMAGYARLLGELTDPTDFPAVHALLAAGVFDHADHPDKEFAFGLTRILDGVEVLIAGRGPGA
jgi:AcrR family transcriptional regulator